RPGADRPVRLPRDAQVRPRTVDRRALVGTRSHPDGPDAGVSLSDAAASSRAACVTTDGPDRAAAAHGSSPSPAPPPSTPAPGGADGPAGGCGPCAPRPLRTRPRLEPRPGHRPRPVSPAVPARARLLGW